MKDLAKRLALRLSVLAQAVLFQTAWGQVSPKVDKGDARPLVVCTAYVIADMAEVIGGDVIRVETLVPPRSGVRDDAWELYLNKLFDRADLVLVNGSSTQASLVWLWGEREAKGSLYTVANGIEYLPGSNQHRATNPPAWVDARNGLIYANNIHLALATAVPEYADQFAFNYGIYRREIEELDAWIRDTLDAIPQQARVLRNVNGDAPLYFGRAYGLRVERLKSVSDYSGDIDKGRRRPLYEITGHLGGSTSTYLDLLRRDTRIVMAHLTEGGHANPGSTFANQRDYLLILIGACVVIAVGTVLIKGRLVSNN